MVIRRFGVDISLDETVQRNVPALKDKREKFASSSVYSTYAFVKKKRLVSFGSFSLRHHRWQTNIVYTHIYIYIYIFIGRIRRSTQTMDSQQKDPKDAVPPRKFIDKY